MNLSTTYLLNVALHAGVLSIFAALPAAFLRLPQQRSFVAIAGLLAVGFLPWITALRPAPAPRTWPAITEAQAAPPPAELPLWTIVTVPVRNEASEPPAPPAPPVATAEEWKLPDFPTSLMALWAAGTGIGLALFTIAWVKVMIWKKSLARPDDAAWQKLQSLVPDHLGTNDFLICPSDASPCVIGFWRTRIVIPRFLLGQPTENLGWAVRHEIAHHQAGDSRWMMLFTFIRCVNWWNPLAHRLITTWADAREQLCDLHATSLADNRADYGEFLITMARNIGKQPPLSVAMAKRLHVRQLKQRIVSLLESQPDAVKPVGKGFACLSSGLFVIIVMGVSSLKIGAEEIQNLSDKKTDGEAISIVSKEAVPKQPVQPSPSPGHAAVNEPEPSGKADYIQTKRQTKTSTRFIITDYNPGFDAEPVRDGGEFTLRSIFSEGQVALIMRSFASRRGADLLTLPSITALSGQVGTIEATKPVLGTAEQIAKRGKEEVPFMGIRFTPVSRFTEENPPSNGAIELNLTLDYRFIPGIDPSSAASENRSSEGLNPEEIKVFKKTVHGNLFSGYTLGLVLGEIEPGKYISVFTKVEIIDETEIGRAHV